MRKRLFGIAAMAAMMTLSASITAFAGTWKEDTLGKYYENDDGSRPVYAGWFTDPADGTIYYMDPDGYMMSNTTVEGFRLGDDGRRVEKTAEDLQREAERKAVLASRPSPAKKQAAADLAAQAAKTSTASTSTLRASFQAEMEVFMEKIFTAARDKRTDTTVTVSGTDTSAELTYGFANPDGYRFISTSIWKAAKATAVDYHEEALTITYHRGSAVSDIDNYNDAYNQLVVAALGDNEGKAVLDYVNSESDAGNTSFDRSGNTDTGNSYKLSFRGGLVTIAVTCSEVDPTAASDESAAADTADTTDTAVQAPSTSVIVAGQSSASTEDTETTDDTDATDDTESAGGSDAEESTGEA